MSHVIIAPRVSILRTFSSSSCFFKTSRLRADFASSHQTSFFFSSRLSVLAVRVLSAVPRFRVYGVVGVPLPIPLIVIVGEREEGVVLSQKGNVAVRVGTRNPLAKKKPFWQFWGTRRCFLPGVAGGRGVGKLGGV